MVDINGLRCYIHTEMDCCETGDNPSLVELSEIFGIFCFPMFSNLIKLFHESSTGSSFIFLS